MLSVSKPLSKKQHRKKMNEYKKTLKNLTKNEILLDELFSNVNKNNPIKFKNNLLRMLNKKDKEWKETIEKLIVNEILICHHENTPTSRLTSLINKIKEL